MRFMNLFSSESAVSNEWQRDIITAVLRAFTKAKKCVDLGDIGVELMGVDYQLLQFQWNIQNWVSFLPHWICHFEITSVAVKGA